jgi:hypothetical protein
MKDCAPGKLVAKIGFIEEAKTGVMGEVEELSVEVRFGRMPKTRPRFDDRLLARDPFHFNAESAGCL